MLDVADFAVVLELCLLSCEALLDVGVVAVLDVSVLHARHIVRVLFG